MTSRLGLCSVCLAIIAFGGCENRPAPSGRAMSKEVPSRSSSTQTKELTDGAFRVWLDLVTTWHNERKPDRLERVAKALGWEELTPEILEVVGAKRGYVIRVADTAGFVGGDDEGGTYSIVMNSTLDSDSIVRQLGEAFDTQECADLDEAGLKGRVFSLIGGGVPVGIALLETSKVESVPSTRIGFVSIERMKQAGLKLPPNLAVLSELITNAKAENAAAQVELGDAYFTGVYCKSNPAIAVEYWQMAAKQKSPSGFHRLAIAYYTGSGIEKNQEIAHMLFEQAANSGDADGQAMMGWIFATGYGKPRDSAKAANWLQRAVTQGHAGAANNLAGLYEKGWGVAKDQNRAIALYRDSAAKGYGLAYVNLGRAYSLGSGVPVDKIEAVKCFQAAADMGVAEGEFSLAVHFMEGRDVPRDLRKAADLFERAANKGHSGAQNNLGLILAKGDGRDRNLIEAAKWWIIASAAGNVDATANLPEMKRTLSQQDLHEAERRAAAFSPERKAADLLANPLK